MRLGEHRTRDRAPGLQNDYRHIPHTGCLRGAHEGGGIRDCLDMHRDCGDSGIVGQHFDQVAGVNHWRVANARDECEL